MKSRPKPTHKRTAGGKSPPRAGKPAERNALRTMTRDADPSALSYSTGARDRDVDASRPVRPRRG
jgi:hypothetical protein